MTYLSIILYLLILLLRYQQGGWDISIDLFQTQRAFLDQKIAQLLPSPQAQLLSGIVLGQSKVLPGSLKLALRDTATLHIAVASGQNLTIVAGFFLSLAGLIKRKMALILSVGCCIFYTLLSGMQVPILRAAIMFVLAAIAQLTGRQKDSIRVLIITGGLMLLINPNWLTNLSFQLSFLATIGVMVVAPIFKPLAKLPIIGQDLAVTLGAQLMVLPVIAQNFHQISLVSLIANLLILGIIPLIMLGGGVMLLVGLFWLSLGQLIAILVNSLVSYVIFIVTFFASLSFAWEYVGEQWWVVWIGYYLILGGLLMGLKRWQTASEFLETML